MEMFRLVSHITLGKFKLNYVASLEMETAWNEMTDKLTIRFPRKLQDRDKNLLQDLVRPGAEVQVQIGYDDNLELRFIGYVREVMPHTPLEIVCEDKMYSLKKQAVKPRSWSNAKLEDVLDYMGIKDYRLLGAFDLGPFQITEKRKTVAKVLERIREMYGLVSFFRLGTLCIGNPYDAEKQKKHDVAFGVNIIDNDLVFRRKEDIQLKVTAISNFPDNSKLEVQLGDEDGEERTLNYYKLPKKALAQRAKAELENLKYEGYRGSITLFGLPVVNHGDVVNIKDSYYPERSGSFLVDKVNVGFGTSGYRQIVSLGPIAKI